MKTKVIFIIIFALLLLYIALGGFSTEVEHNTSNECVDTRVSSDTWVCK